MTVAPTWIPSDVKEKKAKAKAKAKVIPSIDSHSSRAKILENFSFISHAPAKLILNYKNEAGRQGRDDDG
jgi:hypothetical protein